MRKYELLYILKPTLDDEALKEQNAKILELIQSAAEDVTVDEWGKRSLAYEIQDLREGYYVIVNFSAQPDFPKELERVLHINDSVLRVMVTHMEHLEK